MTDAAVAAAPYLRIATEEAWAPTGLVDVWRRLLDEPDVDPGFVSTHGFYMTSDAERPRFIREHIEDLGERRLAVMDATGIDRQVIAITSPGVQIMSATEGAAFARDANDELAEGVAAHPDRFSGLIAVAPHAPEAAAAEIERGMTRLGLSGVIINDHTHGEYLDHPRFRPVLEAAEALDAPIYLHPNTAPRDAIRPYLEAGLDGAIYGFGVETGLHALRMITAGVFDRFPRLRVILGHMGEALPYWSYRLDYMHAATVRSQRYEAVQPLQRKVSDYLRDNFVITNSGVAWEPAIRFAQETLGVQNVMYAMDYPYQTSADEVRALDAMPMDPAAKRAFFQTNAERVFKLG